MLSSAARGALRRAVLKNNVGDEIANAIDFLQFDPWGIQRGRVLALLDLTGLAAKYVNLTTLPAGSIIRFMGIQVAVPVVASGTSVKIGLGDHSFAAPTTPYVLTGDLLKNTQDAKYFNGSPLNADTPVDLLIATTAGTALGSGNITAGQVVVSIIADLPPMFPLNA